MRLSDAIRKGCTIYAEQYFMGWASRDGRKACVMHTACAGWRGIKVFDVFPSMREAFPILRTMSECPVLGGDSKSTVENIAMHLNDFHRWTREAIADWVETLEMGATPE